MAFIVMSYIVIAYIAMTEAEEANLPAQLRPDPRLLDRMCAQHTDRDARARAVIVMAYI